MFRCTSDKVNWVQVFKEEQTNLEVIKRQFQDYLIYLSNNYGWTQLWIKDSEPGVVQLRADSSGATSAPSSGRLLRIFTSIGMRWNSCFAATFCLSLASLALEQLFPAVTIWRLLSVCQISCFLLSSYWNSPALKQPFCSCFLFATGIKLPVSCCHLLASLLELTGIRTAISSCHHLAKLLEPVSEQLHICSCHHSADLWYSPVRKQLFLAAKL